MHISVGGAASHGEVQGHHRKASEVAFQFSVERRRTTDRRAGFVSRSHVVPTCNFECRPSVLFLVGGQ